MSASAPGKTIEFYFDFSSPYSYFAAMRVDELADSAGRRAVWKPILLGAVFKETAMRPLADIPIKGDYAKHDWVRMGRMMSIPYKFPTRFPIPTQAAARAFYWLDERDPEQARLFAKAAYHAYFAEDVDISIPEKVIEIAAALHVDPAQLAKALEDSAIKDRLRRETSDAVAKGVFGAPYFFVDGEPFWGSDRMWMVKRWMKGQSW